MKGRRQPEPLSSETNLIDGDKVFVPFSCGQCVEINALHFLIVAAAGLVTGGATEFFQFSLLNTLKQ